MITEEQKLLLQNYRDRAYISSILCEEEKNLNTFSNTGATSAV